MCMRCKNGIVGYKEPYKYCNCKEGIKRFNEDIANDEGVLKEVGK